MGAVINATFGSIIEIILYAIALTQNKGHLVEGSIVGSFTCWCAFDAGYEYVQRRSAAQGADIQRKKCWCYQYDAHHGHHRCPKHPHYFTRHTEMLVLLLRLSNLLTVVLFSQFQLVCSGCPSSPSTLPVTLRGYAIIVIISILILLMTLSINQQ